MQLQYHPGATSFHYFSPGSHYDATTAGAARSAVDVVDKVRWSSSIHHVAVAVAANRTEHVLSIVSSHAKNSRSNRPRWRHRRLRRHHHRVLLVAVSTALLLLMLLLQRVVMAVIMLIVAGGSSSGHATIQLVVVVLVMLMMVMLMVMGGHLRGGHVQVV